MKKTLTLLVTLLLVAVSVVFAACTDTPSEQTSVQVSLNVSAEQFKSGKFYIDKDLADSFDFSKLFAVTEGNKPVTVTSDMLDVSQSGEFGCEVTCTYKGKSATAEVVYEHNFYQLELSRYTLTVSPSEALGHNYKSYFKALINGDKADITDDMVTTDVEAKAGSYTYSVTFHGQTKTLKISVEDLYEIGTYKSGITMEAKDVAVYDFLADFYATKNGEETKITEDCLDFSDFPRWGGEGKVVCRMGSYSAEIPAKITANEFIPSALRTEITLNSALVADFDATSLFALSVDGEPSIVYANMLQGSIGTEAGEYVISLTTDNKTVSVKVTVVEHQVVVAVVCYPEIRISTDQTATFDCTELFMLYVDDVAVPVTADMLQTDKLRAATEEGNYDVTLSYTRDDGSVYTAKATVTLSDEQTVSVSAVKSTAEVYPNSTPLDLSSLFVVTDNGANVPVTAQMLEGSVNYVVAGDYVVKCTYKGISASVTVTVKDGVVVLTRADTLDVKAGTSMLGYNFAADFKTVVNGIVLSDVSRYITVDGKTLSELTNPVFEGGNKYEVTIKIPYNATKVGITGSVKFEVTEATITYVAAANTYTIDVLEDVVLPDDAKNFNPFANISVHIDGQTRSMTLTDNIDYVDPLTLYAVVVSGYDPTAGIQQIDIDVYVNGPKNAPVRVSYVVEIHDKLDITVNDKLIFVGETLYTTDLFSVVRNGVAETVTADMVYGKVDVFTPGSYVVTLRVDNAAKTAHVTVLDKKMVGTYKTKVLTIASDAEYDDDGEVVSDATAVRLYADLIVGSDASLAIGKYSGAITGGEDDYYLAKIGTTEYKMYYDDGIIVLVPVNELRMKFSGTTINRVLTYVSEDLYDISNFVVINNQSSHVINYEYSGYFTVEAVQVRSKADGSVGWYAARTGIKEVYGNDTVYSESHGEIIFNDGFTPDKNVSGSYAFGGETYSFTIGNDGYTGRIVKAAQGDNPFAGTYNGTVDGVAAVLTIGRLGQTTLTTGSGSGKVTLVDVGSTDISAMRNGGVDLNDNTFFVYRAKFGTYENVYFSYKFAFSGNRFTVVEKDKLFGYYVLGDKFIFLDGYGTGFVHFDGESYETVDIAYTATDNEVYVEFTGAKTGFAYGSSAEFYLSPLLNVLTVKRFADESLEGGKFVNTQIIDGAVVTVNKTYIRATATSTASVPDEFWDLIEVTDKNGAWTKEQKSVNIDCSAIRFGKAGVYRYGVKNVIGGKTVTSYFVLEVLAPVYEDNVFVGEYANSFGNTESCSITLDKFGKVTMVLSEQTYQGYFDANDEKLVCRVSDGSSALTVNGKIANGVLFLSISGRGNVCVTSASVQKVGNGRITLAKLTSGSNVTYYLTVNGKTEVTEPIFDGDNVTLVVNGKATTYRIASWNDRNGLADIEE